MFNESKYTTYYYDIINKAKNRTLSDDIYTEKHHIIPKSLNGNNTQENLVILTLREHYICHWLLTKMFDHNKNNIIKMHHALWNMINTRKNIKIPSRLYEQLKTKHYQIIKGSQTGEKNGFYGKTHTEEVKQKCGDRTRGKTYEDIYGPEKANEIKRKQLKFKKGRKAWNKGLSVDQKIRETIRKNKNNNKVFRWWKITLPDQSIQITKDRREFCNQHNLNYNTVNDYSQKQKPYKGYYFEKSLPPTHFSN